MADQAAAIYNPITYVLEAMRSVLLDGWQAEVLARGFASAAVLRYRPVRLRAGQLEGTDHPPLNRPIFPTISHLKQEALTSCLEFGLTSNVKMLWE